MPQVTHSTTINRPVGDVFRLAGNFDNAPQWQPDVESNHQTEDKMRVGVMITQHRRTRLLGWRLDLNADIVGYQPNRLIEYKGMLGNFNVNGRMEFASSGGTTTVTETMDIRMGFLYGLFAPFMRGVMKRRTRIALENLKTLLETKSAGTATPTNFHEGL